MCGFAGLIQPGGGAVDAGLLDRMVETIRHRGPDEQGRHVGNGVGLATCRLSILDLARGQQPMGDSSGQVWVAYNGEIYNFRQIRAELEGRGRRFRTDCDTEVLLESYLEWGDSCVDRFNGMYAFSIWDGRMSRALLVRDRIGIKPLFYSWDGRRLLFASEPKAIFADPQLSRETDADAIHLFLSFLYIPAPHTIWKAVRKLRPGHRLVLEGGRLREEAYWRPQDVAPRRLGWSEAADELRWLLEEVVRMQLVSDVPLGAFLSGGIDSSTVVAMMSKVSSEPPRTFSIGFDMEEYSELADARRVADHFRTRHTEELLYPDVLSLVPEMVRHFDEPFGDSSMIPTYCVSRLARREVKVCLSGDGGDELFLGYSRYPSAVRIFDFGLPDRFPISFRRRFFGALSRMLPDGMKGKGRLRLFSFSEMERYGELVFAFPPHAQVSVLDGSTVGNGGVEAPYAHLASLWTATEGHTLLRRLQLVDVLGYLPDDILAKVDRSSMRCSLEVRVPLLDHRLMEFALSLPDEYKLRAGERKALLRAVVEDLLPPENLAKRKWGFVMPLSRWLQKDLVSLVDEVLGPAGVKRLELFEPRKVARLLEEHRRGKWDRANQIWALLVLGLWWREAVR